VRHIERMRHIVERSLIVVAANSKEKLLQLVLVDLKRFNKIKFLEHGNKTVQKHLSVVPEIPHLLLVKFFESFFLGSLVLLLDKILNLLDISSLKLLPIMSCKCKSILIYVVEVVNSSHLTKLGIILKV
jgi:hypothetical protein